jgi:hypothetical protein
MIILKGGNTELKSLCSINDIPNIISEIYEHSNSLLQRERPVCLNLLQGISYLGYNACHETRGIKSPLLKSK